MGAFKNSWRNIRRSPYQALAAISILTLTFIVTGIFVLLSLGSAKILQTFEQRPQIIVFFKDTKVESEILELVKKLQTQEKVASVKYVSKEDALSIYKEQFKNDPLLLEMVSADILPASVEVSATKIEHLSDLAKSLEKETDVEEIVYQKDLVDFLVSWTSAIKRIGLILVIFLGLVALLTVVTVVAMKIALKRMEIEILQLVGASSWYIRMPFLIEGAIYGLIGGTLGAVVNLGVLLYALPSLSSLFAGIPILPIPVIFYVVFVTGMSAAGIMLGLLASMLAINRYLK